MRPHPVIIQELLISALLAATSSAVMADEILSEEELSLLPPAAHTAIEAPESSKVLPAREILASIDEADADPFTQRFHFTRKGPVEYRQQFKSGSGEIALKIYGPVVKKQQGLGVKVLGVSIGDYPVEFEGYGNIKKQGINFTIRF